MTPELARAASSTSPGGARAMSRLDELAKSSEEAGRLTRLYLTPQHKHAALQVKLWMEDAGMTVRLDAVGNMVGRYEGADMSAPVVLIGSHIDTVRNAGKYDGCLGVVVAIEAIAALNARRERLPFAVDVVAFGDEEGVRFPVTLTGSKGISGTLDMKTLATRDAAGVSIREALAAFGCPRDAKNLAYDRAKVRGYLEVHIEQGPILESMNLPVGIVTAITGASRARVTITGTAGHAGTVPMNLRRDAGAAAAEMMLAVERHAHATDNLVATVGQIHARPGAVNVIPGEAEFTIDLRSPLNPLRAKTLVAMQRDFEAIAKHRRVGVVCEKTYDQPVAPCDAVLMEHWEKAVSNAGVKPFRLASGAGHDGLAMIALCPIAMLFVRCRGGISHNPAEAVDEPDVGIAIGALTDMLRQFSASDQDSAHADRARAS